MIWLMLGKLGEWRRKRWLTKFESDLLVHSAVKRERDLLDKERTEIRQKSRELDLRISNLSDIKARHIPELDDIEVKFRVNRYAIRQAIDPEACLHRMLSEIAEKIRRESK